MMSNWLSQLFGVFKPLQWWIVIAPWEQGLRVRLGKTANVLGAGLHWRIPFLDRIFVQSVRLRMISNTGQTMTTKDGKTLTLAISVAFAITDLRRLYDTVNSPDMTLLDQVQGLVARHVAERNSDEITPTRLERVIGEQLPSTDWGLSQVQLLVTSFAYVRVYRIMNNDYRTLSSSGELDQPRMVPQC